MHLSMALSQHQPFAQAQSSGRSQLLYSILGMSSKALHGKQNIQHVQPRPED
jgi:hypothetical protein